MERWKSITILTYIIYSLLMAIFYFAVGGTFLDAYIRLRFVSDMTVHSLVKPLVIFIIIVGVILALSQVISFLWFFNVTTVTKWAISYSSMILDIFCHALYFSVTVGACCFCSIINYSTSYHVSYSGGSYISTRYLDSTNFTSTTYETGIALAILSVIGVFYALLVAGLKIHEYVLLGKEVNQASMNSIA